MTAEAAEKTGHKRERWPFACHGSGGFSIVMQRVHVRVPQRLRRPTPFTHERAGG